MTTVIPAEGDAELAPEQDSPLFQGEEILRQVDPHVQAYGESIQALKLAISTAIDHDTIAHTLSIDYPDDVQPSRDLRRHRERVIKDEVRNCKAFTVDARVNAQLSMVKGVSDEVREAAHERARQRSLDLHSGDLNAYETHQAKSWVDVYNAECTRLVIENSITHSVQEGLARKPESIFEIAQLTLSEDLDVGEYLPVLKLLANSIFDPEIDDLFAGPEEQLLSDVDVFRPVFLALLDECFGDDPGARENARQMFSEDMLDWISFVMNLETTSAKTPSTIFTIMTLDSWPKALREVYELERVRAIQTAVADIRSWLRQFVDKALFIIPYEQYEFTAENFLTPEVSSKKRRKGSSRGRTSHRNQTDEFLGVGESSNETTRIASLGKVALGSMNNTGSQRSRSGTLNGAVELDYEDREAIDAAILEHPTVASYLSSHSSDPDLKKDLLNMVKSLLEEPRGNGASKLTSTSISIQNGVSTNRKYPVWHLNPTKRTNLSIGNTARQTRIDYILRYDKATGETHMDILRIAHKQDLEKSQ